MFGNLKLLSFGRLLWSVLIIGHIPALAQQPTGHEGIEIWRVPSEAHQGFPAAVRVSAQTFGHTTQLLPESNADSVAAQSKSVLSRLGGILKQTDSEKSSVIQLNAYVTSFDARTVFEAELKDWFGRTRPAITWVATPLPNAQANVGLDAVFVSNQQTSKLLLSSPSESTNENPNGSSETSLLPPGDVVYLSGQATSGELAEASHGTLQSLEKTLHLLELKKEHIVQIKCFMKPMTEVATVNQEIASFFGDSPIPPVSHVEWTSGSRAIEIELVAWAPASKSEESVSYATPPGTRSSPVYSRVARIHGQDRIYISGIFAANSGSGEEQVLSIYETLQSALKLAGSDLNHLAKATYYVSAADSSDQLNKLRPNYYDPKRPPAASKAMMKTMAAKNRSIHIEMIAAP